MTPLHSLVPWVRRHPLALATAASLALHGAALAASHYMWRGTAPAPINTHTVALVMIEDAAPTPESEAVAAEPKPVPHLPSRTASVHDDTPAPEPAPAKPIPPGPKVERPDTAKPIAMAPPRRPPIPREPTAAGAMVAPPESASLPEPAVTESIPTSEAVPSATPPPRTIPPEAATSTAGTDVAVNHPPKTMAPPRYGIAGVANPRPRYPWLSRQRGEEGRVILRVGVDEGGHAVDVTVAASSGHGRLDRAALAAVRLWRFEPARRAGRAVAGTVDVPVTFRLSDE